MKRESSRLSSQMLSLLEKNGINEATPIQKEIIPAILSGKDILAQSETGSGKTISFAVPLIEQITVTDGIAALILVPTRELCMQITGEFSKFSKGKNLGITSIYGGVSMSGQISKIKKTNIVVATPGRLIDLLDRRVLKLDKVKFLVFDEADRMLDMGFVKDIERILKSVPAQRQTMLFSATVSKEIVKLSKKYLKDPIIVEMESSVKPEFLQQVYYKINPENKFALLVQLLKKDRELALIFCNRKHVTDKLATQLTRNDIPAKCLNGDMSQDKRERVTEQFRKKKFSVLIATDVASRGLHIEDISHVYNYEIPRDVESYTHRVGRTARAGKKGEAISFVSTGEDKKFFKQILFNYSGIITLKNEDILKPEKEIRKTDKSEHKTEYKDKKPERTDRKPERTDRKPERTDRKPERTDRKPKQSDRKPDRKEKDFKRREQKPERRNQRNDRGFRKSDKPDSRNERPPFKKNRPGLNNETLEQVYQQQFQRPPKSESGTEKPRRKDGTGNKIFSGERNKDGKNKFRKNEFTKYPKKGFSFKKKTEVKKSNKPITKQEIEQKNYESFAISYDDKNKISKNQSYYSFPSDTFNVRKKNRKKNDFVRRYENEFLKTYKEEKKVGKPKNKKW